MSAEGDSGLGPRVLYVGASEQSCAEMRELLRVLVPAAEVVCRGALPETTLPPADVVLIEPAATAGPGNDRRWVSELRRARQLVAAGELALKLQHSLNNPLAALLAEAQLLEMEPLADEHRAAVGRMVQLCRRMVAIVRELDAVKGPAASR